MTGAGAPLPAYSYVPGLFPHPYTDPRGHSYGQVPTPAEPPQAEAWSACLPYLRGVELFNAGYYWEAHEAWESLWHACGRTGSLADFFKALIQLAVAGVKLREGRGDGAVWHARRAEELLETLPGERWLGLAKATLVAGARQVQLLAPLPADRRPAPVERMLPLELRPT